MLGTVDLLWPHPYCPGACASSSPAAPASSARTSASACSSEGHDVICLDNFFTGQQGATSRTCSDNHRFELIRHDVTEPILLEVDQIYNLACPASPVHYQYNPVKTIKTSVMGTINMLGLAKRVKARILQASTSEVYGDPLDASADREPTGGNVNPIGIRSCYDEGKRVAETLMMDYHRQNKVDIRIVRIFNTYGPRMALERRPGGLQLHRPGAAGRGPHRLRRRQRRRAPSATSTTWSRA